MNPLLSRRAAPLKGEARPPGDKSISHRALMVGAVSVGETTIRGLLEGADVLATATALRALGAAVSRDADGMWHVHGRGVGGLAEPDTVLDLGNAGTGARLLMGLLASQPGTVFLTGDASLRARPMDRVIDPLTQMGACVVARGGTHLPLALTGAADPVPLRYRLTVPSAQVKSAILLAGLNTPGVTTVIEPWPTRDHTERMLRHFGADVTCNENGPVREVSLVGLPELEGRALEIPGDPSSAAFAAVAAAMVPGSRIVLRDVGVNPLRMGLYRTLEDMGADLTVGSTRLVAGEPVADISVRAGPLRGVRVPAERAPTMIDEYPVLAVAAASAEGTTVLEGVGELRVKESDRLAAVAEGLAHCGIGVEQGADSLTIHGAGGPPPGPRKGERPVESRRDHRIAMAFLVLGMAAERQVTVDDGSMIETSFPGFVGFMNRLGANIERPDEEDRP